MKVVEANCELISVRGNRRPRCLAWVTFDLARRRYIPFPKLLKLKADEFWRRTGDVCS